ncbi:hypothetical protein pneo_cds_710 [Pandoravirus neocaledonia]|uniref:Uncharacterized protein n=1 Tax=Pandoravirus neocaledonia TaxID=2107708 RepID=A0A2U7UD14_9VIRU|nr:hypothetical protein pneo_cds_710 [Pandoravirus neocaledonia]AVK76317.1 hypothetical protein pneo_cds_710 [Pandoravirus neocaledonia]
MSTESTMPRRAETHSAMPPTATPRLWLGDAARFVVIVAVVALVSAAAWHAVTSVAHLYGDCVADKSRLIATGRCFDKIACSVSPYAQCAFPTVVYMIYSTATWGMCVLLWPLIGPVYLYDWLLGLLSA